MNKSLMTKGTAVMLATFLCSGVVADNLAERKQEVNVENYSVRMQSATAESLSTSLVDQDSFHAFQQSVPSSLAEQKHLDAIGQYSLIEPDEISERDARDSSVAPATDTATAQNRVIYGAHDFSGQRAIDNKNRVFGVGN